MAGTAANASDRQIGSRAIQTFQDGPFSRVVEAGLFKYFIPSAIARIKSVLPENMSKLGKGGGAVPLPPPPGPYAYDKERREDSGFFCPLRGN